MPINDDTAPSLAILGTATSNDIEQIQKMYRNNVLCATHVVARLLAEGKITAPQTYTIALTQGGPDGKTFMPVVRTADVNALNPHGSFASDYAEQILRLFFEEVARLSS